MKKTAVFLTLVLASLATITPIPPPGKSGAYNTVSGWIVCTTKTNCLHEIGHKIDHESDWMSRTEEFALAVELFVCVELRLEKKHPFAYRIIRFPGIIRWDGWFSDPQAELYASLFEWSGGVSENMPESLRPFYDWERAKELMKKYEDTR